ncbi:MULTISPECIES: NADH oxidase [unclassified Streptomyces]|uniref:NADH oxidase n=1 Tax=unclassified Streptomyces TaxID=2593676 RepID=UPI001BEC1574|nr:MULTISPECIES: NADH oxidase [unclassified Streptomyces]MBT2404107.1 NADH oxidase [Streptomyces sp. ISL-21]MBT2454390.1 NADH oxidase [Streptomyces sp. ISL-86]MBT2607848.1 NADH oxidase [Streptomyces sp. ISL-87]
MRRTTGDAPTVHLWSLSEDVVVDQHAGSDSLVLTSRWGQERLDRPAPVVREVLRRMELGPVLLANALNGSEDLYVVMLPTLSKLSHLVVRTLGVDDLMGPLLSVLPLSPAAPFVLVRQPRERRVRLPRHVALSVPESGIGCVLESVDSPHRVVLHRPEAAWVATMLAWPTTPDAASKALPLPPQVTEDIIGYLCAAGMVTTVDDPGGEPGAEG